MHAWNELRQSVYSEPIGLDNNPSKAKIDLLSVNTRSDVGEKRFSSHIFKRPRLAKKLDVIELFSLPRGAYIIGNYFQLWYDPKRVCSAWKALRFVSDVFKQNEFFK